MGHWSKLPIELLRTIEEYLVLYVDKVRLRAICTSWNSSLSKMPNHRAKQLPWLLHPLKINRSGSYGLLNLVEKKVYELDLPEIQGKFFIGSSHGWVVTVEHSPAMYLINPLTRARIQLPPRTTFPDVKNYRPDKVDNEYALLEPDERKVSFYPATLVNTCYMHKVVLSGTPSAGDDNCVVVAIYGECGRLAYCTCNDKKWTCLRKNQVEAYSDVIFYKGKLHALKTGGQVLAFENIGSNPTVTEITSPFSEFGHHLYLVESSCGELIMVQRRVHTGPSSKRFCSYDTRGFNVYKLDPNNSSWILIRDIGNDMLFLGLNSSMSIPSFDFPGYKKNHIYFTDNLLDFHHENIQGGYDIGVFNLEYKSFKLLPGFNCDSFLISPTPIWVTSSLC